jgi:hypothetical protein
MKDTKKKKIKSSSSTIEYPAGPHSILPNKLLRGFIHNPICLFLIGHKIEGNLRAITLIVLFKYLSRKEKLIQYQIGNKSYIENAD